MTPEQMTQKIIELEHRLNRFDQLERLLFDRKIQMADGVKIQTGLTNGLTIATASTQKLGFYGATPVTRRTGTTGLTADATYGGDEIILINEAHQALLAYGLIG